MNHTFKAAIAVILSGSVTLMTAESASIGMATAPGSFTVNNSWVKGSASVLNGMQVGTDKTASYLVLDGGSQLSLSDHSRGQVFRDRLVLERGTLRVDRASNFEVDAGLVRIMPADASSKMRVLMADQNKVSVDVSSGEARVMNLNGVEVARVFPGEPLSFSMPPGGGPTPQAGAASITKVAGCVQKVSSGGKTYYILTDGTTKLKIEIQGALAEKLAGKYAEVEGSVNTTVTPVKNASQVIEVAKVDSEQVTAGCKTGAGSAGAGVPAWISGVLIAGAGSAITLGGLAATGLFSSSTSTVSGTPISQ